MGYAYRGIFYTHFNEDFSDNDDSWGLKEVVTEVYKNYSVLRVIYTVVDG